MPRAYIGVGSNIEPAKNVRQAIHRLAARTLLAGLSMVYCTKALGRTEQPPYFNCMVAIDTEVPPAEVKRGMLRPIEDSLGRLRTGDKFGPRTIDLDLVVYGDLVTEADGIRLPDPEVLERPFLAIPLFELAPGLVLPGYQLRISDVAARMPRNELKPLANYSYLLRREVFRLAPRQPSLPAGSLESAAAEQARQNAL